MQRRRNFMEKISSEKLEVFLNQLFLKYGASESEAHEIAGHLVESNLTGHDSHGTIRAPWYIDKIVKKEIIPGAPIEVVKETAVSAVVDGNWGFGQPIAKFAMELAIQKAKKSHIGCVTVRKANHIGRLGAYTSLAANNNLIGMGTANLHGTSFCVAPYGAKNAKLPTNPISMAFPTSKEPNVLLDMTSSIVAEGKVKVKFNRGEALPEGWALDEHGNPITDASLFYNEEARPKGAILPLGGHKGYALSMAIDILSGALSGAQCSHPSSPQHGNACWFLALDIEAFVPEENFKKQVDNLIEHVKSAKLADGFNEILYPGEPEYRRKKILKEEGISLEQKTVNQLIEKAAGVNLESPF